jgi:hypothetical protein
MYVIYCLLEDAAGGRGVDGGKRKRFSDREISLAGFRLIFTTGRMIIIGLEEIGIFRGNYKQAICKNFNNFELVPEYPQYERFLVSIS